MALNVLGTDLESCSLDPLTGYFRDGCCNTDEHDRGLHVVCARVTREFLDFSTRRGNDLVTAGASARCAGSRPWQKAWPRRWCSRARTNARSRSSRSNS